MPEENISIFRQELERVKAQFEEKFQDIMTSVRADRENDKRTLQMVNENLNNDRKAIDQNRALNDKLETLLNVQNTMLSELRSMNNSIKDLSGGGGMGGILAAGGAAAAAGAGLTAAGFFGMGGDTDPAGNGDGTRNTGGGDGTRNTGGGGRRSPDGERQPASGDVADRIRTTLMEKFTSEEMREMGIDEEKAAMLTEAFIMNFQDESGLDPDIVERVPNVHGTRGRGLYQLTGPRRDEYESIYGEDYSVENQMDFMFRELMTSESSAFRKILQGETVGETAGAIVRDFLRPAKRHRNERMGRYSQDTRGGSAVLEEYQRMEEERQRREEEASAERISSDQFIRGHLKEMGVAGDGMSLYNPTIRGQQGAGKVHGSSYRGASNAVRAYWSKEELENAGLSTGENTVQLTNPITGELETVNINIQSFDGGNNFATTDFIGTGTLGESREYWNPDLNQAQSIVQNLGGSLGDLDRRKKLNEYIQQKEGITIPYSEVDVEGPEGRRPYVEEAEEQNSLINKYVSDRFEPVEQQIPTEDISVKEDEEPITPGPDDVVVRRFRNSTEVYQRPDGSQYFLQFGRILREIPANGADGSDTLEPQDTLEEDISGGGGDDNVDGGDGNDTLDEPTTSDQEPEPELDDSGDNTPDNTPVEPQDTPLGPRIPEISEETPTQQDETSPEPPPLTEQDPFDPFSLVSPMRLSRDLTTIGLDENPEVRAALEEQAAAGTEETPRETTRETPRGGYTGGGGDSREPEQPQIETNAIGRFPWADKLIKYYNLSDMIKTNMLS